MNEKPPGLPHDDTEIVLRCQCSEAIEIRLDTILANGVYALRQLGWFWGVASSPGSGRALLDPMCGPCARREMPDAAALKIIGKEVQ